MLFSTTLYLDNCISKAEFKDKAASMDMEIQRKKEELGESCKYTFEKQEMTRVINECIEYAKDWMNASEITENFIKEILEEMVIHKNKEIEVKLNLIPQKWKFVIESAKKCKNQAEIEVFDTSVTDVPTSVKRPFNSG